MLSSYLIVTVLVNCIVCKQFNVNAFNLTDQTNFNRNLTDFLTSSDFVSFLNLTKQSKLPNFVDLFSKLNKLQLNSTIHELCGMNTVSYLINFLLFLHFHFFSTIRRKRVNFASIMDTNRKILQLQQRMDTY